MQYFMRTACCVRRIEITTKEILMSEFKNTPKQARALVVEALRSGDYEQGMGALQNADGNACCLGVACLVYLETEGAHPDVDKTIEINLYTQTQRPFSFGNAWAYLPYRVQAWLGFTTSDGNFEGNRVAWDSPSRGRVESGSLADMNDQGATFKQIADVFVSDNMLTEKTDRED